MPTVEQDPNYQNHNWSLNWCHTVTAVVRIVLAAQLLGADQLTQKADLKVFGICPHLFDGTQPLWCAG